MERGQLARVYQGGTTGESLLRPDRSIFEKYRYEYVSAQTSRGCPMDPGLPFIIGAAALAATSVLGFSFLTAGCARTISRTQETHVSGNGTVSTKEKTVTQNPDGTLSQSETRKTTRP